jgi:hypothetical protein
VPEGIPFYTWAFQEGETAVVSELLNAYGPYAKVADFTSNILKETYDSTCASLLIELKDEKGNVEISRNLGLCPKAEVRGEARLPYLTTRKTVSVKLLTGGSAWLQYALMDRGASYPKGSRYYCEEVWEIDLISPALNNAKDLLSVTSGASYLYDYLTGTVSYYDTKKMCERNAERMEEGKEPEVMEWMLLRELVTGNYKCVEYYKGVLWRTASYLSVESEGLFPTQNECESKRPK